MGRRGNIFTYNSPTTNTRFVPLFQRKDKTQIQKLQMMKLISSLEARDRRGDAGMKVNLGKRRRWKPQLKIVGGDAPPESV